ncbi:ABC transporter permease [Halorubellus sp. PRR65]|uniref:ABC transporter permease n=1 Tax=Halorubellus sp. PRR65 TaxID=3098148 RepID=UPI002B260B71|nr:ABC transporter permease [Halorubellus sp. PRR65]
MSDDSGSAGARFAIAKRELAALRSEKTIVLALLIQLFVASFSSFLVVGLVSLYDPGAGQTYQLGVGVAGDGSDEVGAVLGDDEGVVVRRYPDGGTARQAFRDREVDALLLANETVNGTLRVRATVPEENIRTTIAVVQIREGMEELEQRLRLEYRDDLAAPPLDVPVRSGGSPYYGFTYTVLVPLLMFLPVFISGSIAVDSLTEESQRGTLELLRVAPVSIGDIVDAKLFATASLAPVQALAWLVLLGMNGTEVRNVSLLVCLVAGLSLAVVAFGVGIALWSSDRRQAQFLYSTGIIAAATLGGLLPEHPANTVARLAIGTTSRTTIAFAVLYAILGLAAYGVVRTLVGRLDPETI